MFLLYIRQNFWLRLALGFVILIIAIGLSFIFQSVFQRANLYIMLVAIVLSALLNGFSVSVLLSIVAAEVHNFFFQHPSFTLRIETLNDLFEMIVFFSFCLFISWIAASYRRALILAENARTIAERERVSREDLLAMVSHDLKNPLTAILSNAQLMLKLNYGSDSKGRKFEGRLHSIVELGQNMSRLIQDLSDFERMRAGTYEIQLQQEDVNSLLQESMALMQPLAEAKGVLLTSSCESNGVKIECDRVRILQVLSNLIGNAVKFTASGGSIQVEVRTNRDEVIFGVHDTGPGISPNHLSHLFDRYWQGKQSSRQGVGLGLFIAYGIIEAHGNRIWVESKVGVGSSFYFTLNRRV